jgi:FAD/FMN-containing dehydrogenase
MSPAPTITDEVLLAFAADVGDAGPVAVEGARTRWELGGPPDPSARLVRAPNGIVAYQPEEMTVQVRAGTTVAELHAELAAAGQRTALPDRGGTVGGALAVGEDDVCVLGVGRVRTAALQVRYVSAEGRLVTGGGGTVKNVSGYDLPRLLVGSLGTLGLLAEAIVRTNPIPEASVWLVADDADPFAARDALFRPSAVLAALADSTAAARTWVKLEGHASDVAEERRALARAGSFEETGGPPPLPPHRWSLRRSELRHLDVEVVGEHVASIGTGLVFAERPQPRAEVAPAQRELAARTKTQFDPNGPLNPGPRPGSPGSPAPPPAPGWPRRTPQGTPGPGSDHSHRTSPPESAYTDRTVWRYRSDPAAPADTRPPSCRR